MRGQSFGATLMGPHHALKGNPACQEQINLLRAKLNGLVGKTVGAEIFYVLLREAYGECVRSERTWFDKWLESHKGDDDMMQYGDSGVAERLQPKPTVVDLRERLAHSEKAVSRLVAELRSLREQLQQYGISIGPPIEGPPIGDPGPLTMQR